MLGWSQNLKHGYVTLITSSLGCFIIHLTLFAMISLYTKFEVSILGEDTDFKFGIQTDHGK